MNTTYGIAHNFIAELVTETFDALLANNWRNITGRFVMAGIEWDGEPSDFQAPIYIRLDVDEN